MGLNRAIQWSPHIDDAVSALEQLLGLIRVVELDTPFCAARCLIDMDSGDWSTWSLWIRAADCVVEESYLMGAWYVV